MISIDTLGKRALSSYLRTDPEATIPEREPYLAKIDDLYYVILADKDEILAVYRYFTKRDTLKRLRRHPFKEPSDGPFEYFIER